MKDRILASEQSPLESLLDDAGLPIHKGGFAYDPIDSHFTKYPVLAVWHESELPTEEELKTLVEIAQEKISRFNPQYTHGFLAEGANMITVKKEKGQWTYHKLTWRQGPIWSPNLTSLSELRKGI